MTDSYCRNLPYRNYSSPINQVLHIFKYYYIIFILRTRQREAGMAIVFCFLSVLFVFLVTNSQQSILDSRRVIQSHLKMGIGNIDSVEEIGQNWTQMPKSSLQAVYPFNCFHIPSASLMDKVQEETMMCLILLKLSSLLLFLNL